jgi:hypothetical protein
MTTPGVWLACISPPGAGKSYLGASAATLGKTVLFAAPLGELDSYPAPGPNLEVVPLFDENWRPSEGKFVSGGYRVLMDAMAALEKRTDVKVVIFDTMNYGPSDVIWNKIMEGNGTDDPKKLPNPYQPYLVYQSYVKELMGRLDLFRYRTGAHIISLWHEDVRESEGVGAPRKETVGTKTTIHWDVARLPNMRGSIRQDILGWCSYAFYSEPVLQSNPFRCRLVVVPDSTRLAKSRNAAVIAALQKEKEVPNHFPKLLALIEKHRTNSNGGSKS